MSAFGGLDLLLFCYTLYSLYTGEVYVKDRHTGRTILKNEEPFGHWSTIVIYFGFSIGLFSFFKFPYFQGYSFFYLSSNGESTGQTFANIFS